MDPPTTSVIGLSSLRPKDDESKKKPKETAASRAKKAALQSYLAAAYGSGTSDGTDKKKKKKQKGKKAKNSSNLAIVDTDVDTTVRAVKDLEKIGKPGESHETDDEDAPVIVNEGEFKRLEIQDERQKERQKTSGWKVVEEGAGGGASPRRRARHDSDDEEEEEDNESPPRRVRHDSDDDDGDGDTSPPRRARHSANASEDDSDMDVRRKPSIGAGGKDEDSDAPPPRPVRRDGSSDFEDSGSDSDADVPRRGNPPGATQKMSDGTLAGMVTGKELMKEMAEKRRKDIEEFEKLGDSVTGRNAKTVYRTDDGRAVSKEEFEQGVRDKRHSEKGYVEGAELPWGKGLRQAKGAVSDAAEATNVPSRWDDPMGHILAKRKRGIRQTGKSLLDSHAKELRKAGFNVPLEVPAHSWLNRSVAAPPNRFNIKPGRHWDGVDRGQGFEQFVVKTLAEKRQKERLGHALNQEDL